MLQVFQHSTVTLILLDGDRARFGSSEDLQIYHDSNHSYIAENGAGDLKYKQVQEVSSSRRVMVKR
jgi:hypothetical protein